MVKEIQEPKPRKAQKRGGKGQKMPRNRLVFYCNIAKSGGEWGTIAEYRAICKCDADGILCANCPCLKIKDTEGGK